MWTLENLAIVAFAFFLGGISKGVIGLGFPIIVVAVVGPTLGLKVAIPLLVVPGIITNIWQAARGGAFTGIVRRIWSLLFLSVIGIWAGVRVLSNANPSLLIGILGVLLFTYSAISLLRPQIAQPGKHETWLSPVMGATAGFMFGLTGSYMVPGVIYLQALGLKRDHFIQLLGIVFVTISLSLGIFLTRYDLVSGDTALVSATALLPIVLGMLVGQQLRTRLSEETFRTVLFTALCVSGLYMVVRSGLALGVV